MVEHTYIYIYIVSHNITQLMSCIQLSEALGFGYLEALFLNLLRDP
jgi:hypothetical protein